VTSLPYSFSVADHGGLQDHFPKTLCSNLQLNNKLYNLTVIGDVIMPLSRVNIKQNQILKLKTQNHALE